MFELGSTGKDVVTDFVGVIMGRVTYLTGCAQYLLSPKVDSTGKRIASEWFDEDRITLVTDVPIVKIIATQNSAPGAAEPAFKK